MEFYKASLWVIGQKSNAILQKTKSTKEPYLHEQILTMEIKHELQLPASEKTEKYVYGCFVYIHMYVHTPPRMYVNMISCLKIKYLRNNQYPSL